MKRKFACVVVGITSILLAWAQPPVGYYNNATGKTCATLKTALKTIIKTGVNPKSYAALKTQYTLTDIKPRTVGTGSANVIYDIYSTNPTGVDPYQFTPVTNECGTYNSEGDCYNREHSVPQSWFSSSSGQPSPGPGTDYNHIFPTDGEVNARHSNYVYGEVATATWTSLTGNKLGSSATAGITGIVFEPIDSFKGDIARAFLYFVTMYEDDMSSFSTYSDNARAFAYNTFPSVTIPYLKLMIKWHKLDPVSAKEIARNNGAYSFQTNRNPFIDYPEYVDMVWNSSCPGLSALPINSISFSGKLNNNQLNFNWLVSNETNVAKYELERSFNSITYETIAGVEATKSSNYYYSANANDLRGRRVYYRIKVIGNNNEFSYSDVFSIHIPLSQKLTVYPNPVANNISINLFNSATKTFWVSITDLTGRVLLQQQANAVNGLITISSNNFANGTYLLKVNVDEETITHKIVVNR